MRCSACKRPTTKHDEDPNPEEKEDQLKWKYEGGSSDTSFKHSLAISFLISSILLTCSLS